MVKCKYNIQAVAVETANESQNELIPSSFYSHLPTYEDGTDKVFRNVGI